MKVVCLVLTFIFNLSVIAQQAPVKYLVVCKEEIQKSNIKAGTIEPLKIVSLNPEDSSQIVKYTFDIRHALKASFENGNISIDSFKKLEAAYLIDTINMPKWEKSNELLIYIKRLKNSWKIIPDFNYSKKFDDDVSYIRDDRFFSGKHDFLILEYEIPFWYQTLYKRKIEFFIAPNSILPKKYSDGLFNTWGGSRKIMSGKLHIGLDSFLVKIFLTSEHTYFTKANTFFSISYPNENSINLYETGFPVYNAGDSVFAGSRIIMLDTVSINGDAIIFKEVGENSALKGVQQGGVIKALSGYNLASRQYTDIALVRNDKKVTLLHFWGSWCGPCIANMPKLVKFADDYSQKVEIIGFPYENQSDTSKTQKIIKQYNLQWRQIIQLRDHPFQRPDVVKQLFIEHFPTYMLIDMNGKILVRSSNLEDVMHVVK